MGQYPHDNISSVSQQEVDVIKVEPDIDIETYSIYSLNENDLLDNMKEDDSTVKTFPVKRRKKHKLVS